MAPRAAHPNPSRSPGLALLAFALLAIAAWLTLAAAPSHSADNLAGLYIVVDGPYAGVGLDAERDGAVEPHVRDTFDARGRIRNPDGNCNSLYFKGRIEGKKSGEACWRVVPRPRASRLLIDMNEALNGEELARHVNNQKALQNLRAAGRDLEKAFDAVEKATRAGEIGEAKFERMKDDFVEVRQIDEAAEAALRRGERREARKKLERALDLKHRIVDALPGNLLIVQPPDLKPMEAEFMPAQSQTTYTQRATNPDGRHLRYRWTHVAHNDPTCVNFDPRSPRNNQAIWHHGDDQGCSHALEGPRGHVGTITVTVTDEKFECVAIYNGSRGVNGANEGEGPEPARCEEINEPDEG